MESGISSSEPRRTLVLGLGNILMGDEGAGVRVVEALEKSGRVSNEIDLLDGGTAGYALLDIFREYGRVVLVDAVRSGTTPGTICRLTVEDIIGRPDLKLSGHQIDLPEVLALAKRLGELPPTVLLGVEPESVDYDLNLSPVVSAVVEQLVGMVLRELGKG